MVLKRKKLRHLFYKCAFSNAFWTDVQHYTKTGTRQAYFKDISHLFLKGFGKWYTCLCTSNSNFYKILHPQETNGQIPFQPNAASIYCYSCVQFLLCFCLVFWRVFLHFISFNARLHLRTNFLNKYINPTDFWSKVSGNYSSHFQVPAYILYNTMSCAGTNFILFQLWRTKIRKRL